MTRAWVGLIGLGLVALLAATASAATLPGPLPVDGAVAAQGPVEQLHEVVDPVASRIGVPVDDVTDDAFGFAAGTGAAPGLVEPARPPPTARAPAPGPAVDAGTAVGAATGLALLAGLAASQWGHLKFALAGLFVPLFSRIGSNHLLENDARNRVHAVVAENPGITLKEVAQVCGLGWGTTVYHLKRLERERLIVSERHRQFRRFFKNGGGIVNDSKAAFGELKHPMSHRIAQTIVAEPGCCQKDVCQRVGISAPLAHKYLSRLCSAGLLDSHREWKTVKYYPTGRLEDLLAFASAFGHPDAASVHGPAAPHAVPVAASVLAIRKPI